MAERGDLHGEREARAKTVAQLRFVNNNDELLRAHLNHLLAQERTSASLDKVEVRVYLVGAVNGHVEFRVRVQRNERDSQALGLLLRSHGRRDRNDVLQFARLELLAEPLDGKVSRGSSSEPDNHPRFDVVVDGLVPDHLLQFILAERSFRHAKRGDRERPAHNGSRGEPRNMLRRQKRG